MFMVLSSWQNHCESSAGSFDECRTAPSGCQPKTKPDDLDCESTYRMSRDQPNSLEKMRVSVLPLSHSSVIDVCHPQSGNVLNACILLTTCTIS